MLTQNNDPKTFIQTITKHVFAYITITTQQIENLLTKSTSYFHVLKIFHKEFKK